MNKKLKSATKGAIFTKFETTFWKPSGHPAYMLEDQLSAELLSTVLQRGQTYMIEKTQKYLEF